jgi:hypothetical protein
MLHSYLLALLVVILASGCGTSYVPPTQPHIYTSSTQDQHTLSGLTISCETTPDALANAGAAAIFKSKEFTAFFVDGREVLRTDGIRPAQTFLQLPPGEHELVSTHSFSGSVAFGSEHHKPTYRIRLNIARSTTVKVNSIHSIVQSIEGAASYEVLEGPPGIIGKTLIRQAESTNQAKESVEATLVTLKSLRDRGLISNEIYQERALEILSSKK